jgi:ankyrin repeat protein
MIAKLLDKGVDINFVVNDGISPRCALYVALQHGKMETFRYLLSRGADVNAIHPAVIASIFVFLKVDRPETMRALLDAGLDLNKQTT